MVDICCRQAAPATRRLRRPVAAAETDAARGDAAADADIFRISRPAEKRAQTARITDDVREYT